jgi:hypothetical protein
MASADVYTKLKNKAVQAPADGPSGGQGLVLNWQVPPPGPNTPADNSMQIQDLSQQQPKPAPKKPKPFYGEK